MREALKEFEGKGKHPRDSIRVKVSLFPSENLVGFTLTVRDYCNHPQTELSTHYLDVMIAQLQAAKSWLEENCERHPRGYYKQRTESGDSVTP